MKFSHLDKSGAMKMVDISEKKTVGRVAIAEGIIHLLPETIRLLKQGLLKKGDALACARVAGIMAAKQAGQTIPLCHSILLDHVAVDFAVKKDRIAITSTVRTIGRTGAEMEALTAVSFAALTIYDMCKAVDKKMIITGIRLVKKTKDNAPYNRPHPRPLSPG